MPITWTWTFRDAFPLLTIAILCFAGCGEKPVPHGDVGGMVTLDGEPVASGSISFISADGKAAASELDADGRYSMRKVLTGDYKVLVLPPPLPPPGKPGTVKTKGMAEFPGHPKKYRSDLTTDLKAEVLEGQNEFDFDLKPDAAGGRPAARFKK